MLPIHFLTFKENVIGVFFIVLLNIINYLIL